MAEPEFPNEIRDDARAAWHRYVDFLTPFRPELYRYCRRLTGDVWDAEDLVQDTMVRGFGVLGHVHRTIDNPRGYLIRIATNLWVDAIRRRTTETHALALEGDEPLRDIGATPDTTAVRDAAARLMRMLAPQERAALVLKEVFEMSLDEIADMLGTSVGAVKAALHRGRTIWRNRTARGPHAGQSLLRPWSNASSNASMSRICRVSSRSCSIARLSICRATWWRSDARQFESKGSWLWHSVHVHPDLPAQLRPPKFVNERTTFKGEPMVLGFMVHGESKLLMAVVRFEEEDGRISRIRAYNFSPEVIQEVGAELGLTAGVVPYRFPFPN